MGGAQSQPSVAGPQCQVEVRLTQAVQTEDVIAAAEAAGQAILNIYNSDTSKWEVELKSDNSPLTLADKEADKVIMEHLMRLTPHIPIISEETSLLHYDIRKKFQYFWLVDPLDGTKEFLKRNGEFTVNIALVKGDEVVLGVVHVPCQAKTYWAVQGQGAWLSTGGGKPTAIHASKFKLESPGLVLVGSNSHLTAETKEFVELFTSPKFLQVGSSLKLLMVAEGTAHIYPRLAPTCEWDTAAADIIVREAGGVVVQAGACSSDGKLLEDWKTVLMKEQPVVYNKPNMLNPFFVVFGARDAPPAKA